MNIRKTSVWGVICILFLSLLPLNAQAKSSFTDVKERHYAKDAIEWAKKEGLTTGYPDGTFKPDRAITESQFVTMLVRLDCTSPNSFAAKSGEHRSMGNYRYLNSKNIPLRGTNSNASKDSPVERSYAARILAAYQGIDLSTQQAVYSLYINNIAFGITGKNDYEDFAPTTHLTRADAVSLLYNLSLKNDCKMIGLTSKATGKDNAEYAFPARFIGKDEDITSPPPTLPAPPTDQTPELAMPKVTVEKPVLIANGKDSTFVTFTFKSCSGEPIPYDKELVFDVTSANGATIQVDFPVEDPPNRIPEPEVPEPEVPEPEVPEPEVPEPEVPEVPEEVEAVIYPYPELSDNELASNTALASQKSFTHSTLSTHKAPTKKLNAISDGPEVTIKVTAPKRTAITEDIISVKASYLYEDCVLPTGVVTLTYEPKEEIQLEVTEPREGIAFVIATLTTAGGEIASNFDGYVNLDSTAGLPFESSSLAVVRGVAKTSFVVPNNFVKGEIIATARANTTISNETFSSITSEKFSIPVAFSPPIMNDATCTAERPEIGFLIDSSGSMVGNDPYRFRVSKTQEFIYALQAAENIATHFTTVGRFLEKGSPSLVAPAIKRVQQSGGTDIASGLRTARRQFTTDANSRKTLILLTDGHSPKQPILDEVRAYENIQIITIGLGDNLDEALLQQIASETGGQYFHIKESIELTLVYQAILQEINCGIPIPTCSLLTSVFNGPSVTLTSDDIFMATELTAACGIIDKVIVRFSSNNGYLDYELIHRGHNLYRLNKKAFEIQDFLLDNTVRFLAFDKGGIMIGDQLVTLNNH